MAAVFRTNSVLLGKTVACSRSCWDDHIVSSHPILVGHERLVEEAVHNPDIVTIDAGATRRRCLYKLDVGLDTVAPHLKVVVELRRLRAHVVTAYPVNRVKGSEAVAWRRTPTP